MLAAIGACGGGAVAMASRALCLLYLSSGLGTTRLTYVQNRSSTQGSCQGRAARGMTTSMVARLSSLVSPARRAHASRERIHGGVPAGRSSSGITARSWGASVHSSGRAEEGRLLHNAEITVIINGFTQARMGGFKAVRGALSSKPTRLVTLPQAFRPAYPPRSPSW